MRSTPTSTSVYQSNPPVVYGCQHNVGWCPKCRRPVLVNRVDKRLKDILRQTTAEFQAMVIELGITPNPMQLLYEVDPQFGVH